ncbi:nitrite reductase small subunit NirD [Exilibacterium tricleocarpae]|uniref:Nitrite reductase small subunit NirD n=2 Tax=Exilibacterium tricleocarpae TaxID=2591008 RepID=A0A545U5U1_9GAMM|nr:nitrite reductase small subunit NirD [Exilibacterium tricleocarpae]
MRQRRQQPAPARDQWVSVCRAADLAPDTGVCALVNGEQVAIFNESRSRSVYAISNYDPIGGANVLSRGILGSIDDEVVVASPLYKQHFSLLTGACLEQAEHRLKIYPVRIHDGEIQVQTVF